MTFRRWSLSLAVALPLAFPFAALAQDPPGRVGRLAEVRGTAWLTPASGERVSAFLNRPLTQGDKLTTDAGARLEVQVGSAVLRVAERSDLTFTRLDDTHVEVTLASGSLALRVREPELARELLVRTPDGAVAPQGAGLARVDRFGRGSYAWAVEGQWQVQGQQKSWQLLNAGQRVELWRGADGRERIEAAALPHEGDAFERWAQGSDVTWNSADAGVSPEMTGVQDLNRYGNWQRNDDYGSIWFPSQVSAGWSPYSQGQWAWVAPWGWTWIDAMPWGFTPFHYGRWIYIGNQWGWTPGYSYGPRPVYAPALAGMVSGVFNNNPNTPPQGVWRPLMPGQAYAPAYRASPRYVQTLNAPVVVGTGQAPAVRPAPLTSPRRAMTGRQDVIEAASPAATMPGAAPVQTPTPTPAPGVRQPPARVVNPAPAPLGQPVMPAAPARVTGTAVPAPAPAPAPMVAPPMPQQPAVPADRRDGTPRAFPSPRVQPDAKPDRPDRTDDGRGRIIR